MNSEPAALNLLASASAKQFVYAVKILDFSEAVRATDAAAAGRGRDDKAKYRATCAKISGDGLVNALDLAEVITGNRPWASKYIKKTPKDVFEPERFIVRQGAKYLGCKDAMKFVLSFPYKKAGAEFRRACCEVIEAYYVGSGLAQEDAEAELAAAEAERAAAEAERARAEQHAREGFLIVEDSKSMPGCVKVYKQAIDKIPRVTEKPKDDSEAVVFYMWMPCEDYEAELRRVMEMLRGKRVTDKKCKGLYYRLESDDDRLSLISHMNVRMHQYGKGGANTFYK
jgi:hypothetical protein